jgi:3-oxoacyl-[acyl-carrier protein] reductase
MDLGLKDKIALVTGASGGIGATIVRQLAEEGAQVVIHYHSNEQAARRLRDELRVEAEPVRADLRHEADVKQLFKRAQARFGRIDILVANAGISPHQGTPLKELTVEQWDENFQVNVRGTFLCVREFLNLVEQQRHGRIVMIGSTAGRFGEADNAAYAATKSALQALMLSLKNEIVRVAPYATVNIVAPGWIWTHMMDEVDPAVVKKSFQTRAIAWEVPQSEDVAPLVAFLCSDRCARFISGQTIFVDGGMEGRVIHRLENLGELDRFFSEVGVATVE